MIRLHQLCSGGKIITECAVKTAKGTRVADVVWCSLKRHEQIKHEYDVSIAPEICVEIMSPSNSFEEMLEKKMLYFEKGAMEFWLCDEEGKVRFFDHQGELEQSERVPEFPKEFLV